MNIPEKSVEGDELIRNLRKPVGDGSTYWLSTREGEIRTDFARINAERAKAADRIALDAEKIATLVAENTTLRGIVAAAKCKARGNAYASRIIHQLTKEQHNG